MWWASTVGLFVGVPVAFLVNLDQQGEQMRALQEKVRLQDLEISALDDAKDKEVEDDIDDQDDTYEDLIDEKEETDALFYLSGTRSRTKPGQRADIWG